MIYLFTVTLTDPDYAPEDYAEAWVRASEHIQRCPGARGTKLHRSLDDPRRLLAIASWESKEHRDAMDDDPPQAVAGIIAAQAPHLRIELIGQFDDPEWEVLPPA
jgi:hypothetical protein